MSRVASTNAIDKGEAPFIKAWGQNSDPVWSPDGTRIAFVSNRDDHSFIAVYDVRKQVISYMAPGVDFDTSPTWSPDGKQIAFHPSSRAVVRAADSGGGAAGSRTGERTGQR